MVRNKSLTYCVRYIFQIKRVSLTPLEISKVILRIRFLTGFTLLELVVVIIIIGILATLATTQYAVMREKAMGKEAQTSLKLIRARERIWQLERNTYINCTNTADCRNVLGLELSGNNWNYTVTGVTATNFLATANRTWGGFSNCTYTIDAIAENATTTNCQQ